MKKALLTMMTLFLASTRLYASDYFIVLNNGKNIIHKTLKKEELKSLYLGYELYINGEKIHLTHLEANNSATEIFLKDIVGMSYREFSAYWRRKLFSGKGMPPKTFKEESEMINFIKKNESSIGVLPKKPDLIENLLIIPGEELVRKSHLGSHIVKK